ncbi:MAG: xanthine dehydrogenase family protein molybdopterin-binding subunit [Alphaproteobacteria bacterium]
MSENNGEPHGQPWPGRVEDAALLAGAGRFTDDLRLPGEAFAVFVRSPHAAARIRAIEVAAARAAAGVLAVLTGADMAAAGAGNVSQLRPFPGRDGAPLKVPHRPALATDRVHHVGQPVALVIAESEACALDAAELVAIDYDVEPAVVDVRDATLPGAALIWPEAPGNIAIDWSSGSAESDREVERSFAAAAHTARVSLVNQRIVVASLEPRGAIAAYDASADSLTLHAGSQGAQVLRDQLAAALGLPQAKLRVVTGDVGGGFGMKTGAYPEYVALLVAARQLGRPVRWASSRSEAFVSDNQARDSVMEAQLALDAGGRFLALRVSALANMGAFLTAHGAYIATANFARCFPIVYHVPHIAVAVSCVFTNTLPTGPYRGAGRPEANYAMERLVEEAARVTGIDRIELRRRNMIAPAMMPYRTAVGATFDSGEFAAILEEAMRQADYAGFAARQRTSGAAGKRRGIGVSCFLEHAGGAPTEPAEIAFPGDGGVRVALAVQAIGQSHATVFRRLAARLLGIPESTVALAQGDTRLGLTGMGTVASRSATVAGTAIHQAAGRVIAKGRQVAALALEVGEQDIEYADGTFTVAGTDRRISLFAAAARAVELKARGEIAETLDSRETAQVPQTFPNGCHIAEVEIDPETGVATLAAYIAVDDCGVALDPVIVEGQIQGGIAQGVGQALLEHAVYDRESGQLLAGSFMDYAMPRADDLPALAGGLHPVPCRTNPLGVKGVGEAGTTGALAAVMNAIADALPPGAVLDMPATPEAIWRACRAARRGGVLP